MTEIRLFSSFYGYLDEMETPPELFRSLRRADDFIRAAVIAAGRTLEEIDSEQGREDLGLVLATAYGTMQTNFGVLDQIIEGEQTSPTLFSHSVFNAAAGYIASTFNLRGSAFTLTDFTFPFLRGVQEGVVALQSGLLSRCLVLHVETFSELLHEHRRGWMQSRKVEDWRSGSICWLLEGVSERDGKSLHISNIEIEDNDYSPREVWTSGEEVRIDDKSCSSPSSDNNPLKLGMLLSEAAGRKNSQQDHLQAEITAPWGKAAIRFER